MPANPGGEPKSGKMPKKFKPPNPYFHLQKFLSEWLPYIAAVIGTVDGDADALMTCKQTTSGTGILTPEVLIKTFTRSRYRDSERSRRPSHRGTELTVRPGVRRLMAAISQRLWGRLRRAIQICYLSASTVLASASAAVARETTLVGVSTPAQSGSRGWSLYTLSMWSGSSGSV